MKTGAKAQPFRRWGRQLRRAWRLVRAPKRALLLLKKAWRLAKDEGLAQAWKRSKRKLKAPQSDAEGRSAWLEAYHSLAIWVEQQGPRPLAIILSPIDWAWMPQRPHGLAEAMAKAGWCVAFTTSQLRGDEVDHWKEIAPGLVLLADPGLLADRPGSLVVGMHPQGWQEWPRFCAPWLVFDLLDLPELTAGGGMAERAAWRAMLAHADLVLASALSLKALAKKLGRPDVQLVPNAAKPERWAHALPDHSAWGLGHGPIALYAGAIAEWLDLGLLAEVAERLPHWRFVLVGPDFDGTAKALPKLPNLLSLGLMPGDKLPGMYAAATVLFIPFKRSPLTDATSPVKAFEAWAAGLPVVATPLPELEQQEGVLLASDAAGLAQALNTAAQRWRSPESKAQLKSWAKEHSWTQRVALMAHGLRLRAAARARKPHLILLAGVPIDDSGGGQRPAMLARAFLALGWRVSLAHRFSKAEHGDAKLLAAHPWLDCTSWEKLLPFAWCPNAPAPFPHHDGTKELEATEWQQAWCTGIGHDALAADWREVAWANGTKPLSPFQAGTVPPPNSPANWVMVAFPHPDALPLLRAFQAHGYRSCLDLIDAWAEPNMGADWFEEKALKALAQEADVLVASAQPLVAQLKRLVPGRKVCHLPNAVRTECFDPTHSWQRPSDLPLSGPILIYVGALWGEWVDQELMRRLALAWPEAHVVLVGDGPKPRHQEPPNMHRLGLKAQDELPAYLAHAHVGLIPFQVDALSDAVSPLKAYEYIAMGLPVVGTYLPEIKALPGVHLSHNFEGFLAACRDVAGQRLNLEDCLRFRQEHSWVARANALLAEWEKATT